jgi:hypothetical protein
MIPPVKVPERRGRRPVADRVCFEAIVFVMIFYVGVPDVEAAQREAERLGGKRQMGPERARRARWPGTSLTRGRT